MKSNKELQSNKQESSVPALSPQSSNGLALSPQLKEYSLMVAEVNQLIDFKLTGEEIVEWTKEILRLAPSTPTSQLRFVLDCFKTGKIEWVKHEGIQNFFRGLRETRWDGFGWTIARNVW